MVLLILSVFINTTFSIYLIRNFFLVSLPFSCGYLIFQINRQNEIHNLCQIFFSHSFVCSNRIPRNHLDLYFTNPSHSLSCKILYILLLICPFLSVTFVPALIQIITISCLDITSSSDRSLASALSTSLPHMKIPLIT